MTELVARPLLQTFCPELTTIVQPLAGEYAGYRSVFEELSFFTGYGVDIGLLIDVAERFGVDSIAQVDLLTRAHRNRGTIELGRTAAEVMFAMLTRFEELGRLKFSGQLPEELIQYVRGPQGFRRVARRLEVIQRPPIRSVLER